MVKSGQLLYCAILAHTMCCNINNVCDLLNKMPITNMIMKLHHIVFGHKIKDKEMKGSKTDVSYKLDKLIKEQVCKENV